MRSKNHEASLCAIFFSLSFYILPLGSKCLNRHPVLQHVRLCTVATKPWWIKPQIRKFPLLSILYGPYYSFWTSEWEPLP